MFSVVIPLWNKRHTIAATVASVLAQSWGDFELIIMDDGSTDDGMDRLKAFDDPRIRRLAQRNAGPGATRNRGVEAARHDWIAFLDADDVWLPDHLAELDRIRASHPQAGLIGTAFVECDRNCRYRSADLNEGSIDAVSVLECFARGRRTFCTSSSAIPKSTYATVGGFGDDLTGQDREYWFRIGFALPVLVSSRVTVVYRTWTGGITETLHTAWHGRELRDVRDLSASAALLVESYPGVGSSQLRKAIDSYIDADLSACVRGAAKIGDFHALHAVGKLFLRKPGSVDRLLLAISRLPRPLARAIYAFCVGLKALLNLTRSRWRTMGRARTSGRIEIQDWDHPPFRTAAAAGAGNMAEPDSTHESSGGGWFQNTPIAASAGASACT